jgi:hypothetical protein
MCETAKIRLRPAIEDYLGAGAILAQLSGSKSPEAEVCINAFRNSKQDPARLIWNSGSSRELRQRGFEHDVAHSSRLVYVRAEAIGPALFSIIAGKRLRMETPTAFMHSLSRPMRQATPASATAFHAMAAADHRQNVAALRERDAAKARQLLIDHTRLGRP